MYKVGGKQYGTSTSNHHVTNCKETKYEDVGQMIVDMQGKVKSRKIDEMVSRDMCVAAIIAHDLPFKFVEFKKIRSWIKYLNPDSIPITRKLPRPMY